MYLRKASKFSQQLRFGMMGQKATSSLMTQPFQRAGLTITVSEPRMPMAMHTTKLAKSLLLLIRCMYLRKEVCFEHCQEFLGIATVSLDLFTWLLGNQRRCNDFTGYTERLNMTLEIKTAHTGLITEYYF